MNFRVRAVQIICIANLWGISNCGRRISRHKVASTPDCSHEKGGLPNPFSDENALISKDAEEIPDDADEIYSRDPIPNFSAVDAALEPPTEETCARSWSDFLAMNRPGTRLFYENTEERVPNPFATPPHSSNTIIEFKENSDQSYFFERSDSNLSLNFGYEWTRDDYIWQCLNGISRRHSWTALTDNGRTKIFEKSLQTVESESGAFEVKYIHGEIKPGPWECFNNEFELWILNDGSETLLKYREVNTIPGQHEQRINTSVLKGLKRPAIY